MFIYINNEPINVYSILYFYNKEEDGVNKIVYRLNDGRVLIEEFQSQDEALAKLNNVSSTTVVPDETITGVSYTAETGILTFNKFDGSTIEINLPLELLIESASYDPTTKQIILVMANKDTIKVNLSDLVDLYQGDNETIELFDDNGNNKFRLVKEFTDTLATKVELKEVSDALTQTTELTNEVNTRLTVLEDLELQNQINNLLDKDTYLTSRLDNLSSDVTNNTSRIVTNENNINNNISLIGALDTRLKTIEAQDLPTTIDKIEEKSIERDKALENDILDLTESITKSNTEFDNKLSTIETESKTRDDNITNDVTTKYDELKNSITDLTTNLGTVENNVTTLSTNLSTIDTDSKTRDDNLAKDINTKQDKLTEGTNIRIENNTISTDIPTASNDTLGLVKVGENLEIKDGILSSIKGMKTIELNSETGTMTDEEYEAITKEPYNYIILGLGDPLYYCGQSGLTGDYIWSSMYSFIMGYPYYNMYYNSGKYLYLKPETKAWSTEEKDEAVQGPLIDYFGIGLPNYLMKEALTDTKYYRDGVTFICNDDGDYKKGHIYRMKSNDEGTEKSWEDITPIEDLLKTLPNFDKTKTQIVRHTSNNETITWVNIN